MTELQSEDTLVVCVQGPTYEDVLRDNNVLFLGSDGEEAALDPDELTDFVGIIDQKSRGESSQSARDVTALQLNLTLERLVGDIAIKNIDDRIQSCRRLVALVNSKGGATFFMDAIRTWSRLMINMGGSAHLLASNTVTSSAFTLSVSEGQLELLPETALKQHNRASKDPTQPIKPSRVRSKWEREIETMIAKTHQEHEFVLRMQNAIADSDNADSTVRYTGAEFGQEGVATVHKNLAVLVARARSLLSTASSDGLVNDAIEYFQKCSSVEQEIFAKTGVRVYVYREPEWGHFLAYAHREFRTSPKLGQVDKLLKKHQVELQEY